MEASNVTGVLFIGAQGIRNSQPAAAAAAAAAAADDDDDDDDDLLQVTVAFIRGVANPHT